MNTTLSVAFAKSPSLSFEEMMKTPGLYQIVSKHPSHKDYKFIVIPNNGFNNENTFIIHSGAKGKDNLFAPSLHHGWSQRHHKFQKIENAQITLTFDV